jgi:hypothetical protein
MIDQKESTPNSVLLQKMLQYLEELAANETSIRSPKSEFKFDSVAQLVLSAGRSYQRTEVLCGVAVGDLGRCYANAFEATESEGADTALVYVEGYAIGSKTGRPTHHAWLTPADRDGLSPPSAIDPTWRQPARGHGPDEEFAYFGIAFDSTWLRANFNEDAQGVLDNWHNGHQIMQHGIPVEALWNPS